MKKIIIDASEGLVRTALTENGRLIEILIDRTDAMSVAGNIYVGAVKAILPNQFAFVDVGLTKNAFLSLADKREKKIAPVLKRGMELPVQVIKDPSGDKGAYLTSELSLSGRYAVLMMSGAPGAAVSVSKKIADPRERARLVTVFEAGLTEGRGAIVRTGAAGANAEAIIEELNELAARMVAVERDGLYKKAPAIIHGEGPAVLRHLRELSVRDASEIVVNSEIEAEIIRGMPGAPYGAVTVYGGDEPLFAKYSIDRALAPALERKVWLRSGGFLIIDQTEGGFVIDVNSGKFAGVSGHGRSVLETDLEAVDEIAYQIRLRNLSGMIIIDFIGVKTDERALIHARLKDALAKDRIPASVLDASVLGLFVLTRKRAREPLSGALQKKCECCGGSGKINIFFDA